MSDFFKLDLSTRAWTSLDHMVTGHFTPSARSSHGLAALGQNIFMFGGYNGSGERYGPLLFIAHLHSAEALTESLMCVLQLCSATFTVGTRPPVPGLICIRLGGLLIPALCRA